MSFKPIISFSIAVLCGAGLGSRALLAAGDQPVAPGLQMAFPDLLIVPAQDTGEGNIGGDDYGGDYDGDSGGGPGIAAPLGPISNAAGVARAVDAATDFCQRVPAEYAIDCLAYEYWEIQKRLPDFGEMAEAKQVLKQTASELKQLAASNPSRSKPSARIKSRGPKPRETTRSIVPVDTAKLPELKLEAARIVNNGATLLLRATGDSDRKRAQYQQIAQSMQTGAIFLRSL